MCKFFDGSEFIDISVTSLKDIFPILRHSLIAFIEILMNVFYDLSFLLQ